MINCSTWRCQRLLSWSCRNNTFLPFPPQLASSQPLRFQNVLKLPPNNFLFVLFMNIKSWSEIRHYDRPKASDVFPPFRTRFNSERLKCYRREHFVLCTSTSGYLCYPLGQFRSNIHIVVVVTHPTYYPATAPYSVVQAVFSFVHNMRMKLCFGQKQNSNL